MTTSALVVQTAATEWPVTVSDVKSGQLRITHSFEDAHIQNLIAAATRWAEQEMRRVIMNTVVQIKIDRFPRRRESIRFIGSEFRDLVPTYRFGREMDGSARDRSIYLPGGVVSAVESIDYIDDLGAPQTLSGPTSGTPGTDYQEDLTDADEAWLMPASESDWPATDADVINAVTIEYTVGFGADPSAIPDDIKQAIRFRVADLYVIRDSGDAGNKTEWFTAAENLLSPHRVQVF